MGDLKKTLVKPRNFKNLPMVGVVFLFKKNNMNKSI